MRPHNRASTSTPVARLKNKLSRLKEVLLTGIAHIAADTPKTNKMLAMFDPTTFPTAIPSAAM